MNEVDAALRRGRAVECFLGACVFEDRSGFRWLRLRMQKDSLSVAVFETHDVGSASFLDVYEFGPLDPALELDEAALLLTFPDLSTCIATLSERYADVPLRFVNDGVIQEEYADFISRKAP